MPRDRAMSDCCTASNVTFCRRGKTIKSMPAGRSDLLKAESFAHQPLEAVAGVGRPDFFARERDP